MSPEPKAKKDQWTAADEAQTKGFAESFSHQALSVGDWSESASHPLHHVCTRRLHVSSSFSAGSCRGFYIFLWVTEDLLRAVNPFGFIWIDPLG